MPGTVMSHPRFAFVGPTAAVSPHLLAALARVGTLEAVCDDQARRDAERFQARWTFDRLDQLLREAEPDGVVVVRPVSDRSRVIKQCLAAGAGVLVPGSPGGSKVVARIAAYARLTSRPVLAVPAIRYAPAIMMARRLAESGRIDRPLCLSIQSTRRGAANRTLDELGPVSVDQVFEAVFLATELAGPLTRVFAVSHSDGVVVIAAATARQTPVSIVLQSNGPSEAVGVELDLRGADGTRLFVDRGGGLICGNGSRIDAAHRPTLASSDPVQELGYEGLVREFARGLQGQRGLDRAGFLASVVAGTQTALKSATAERPIRTNVEAETESPQASDSFALL